LLFFYLFAYLSEKMGAQDGAIFLKWEKGANEKGANKNGQKVMKLAFNYLPFFVPKNGKKIEVNPLTFFKKVTLYFNF
jgi:hypothetical protein